MTRILLGADPEVFATVNDKFISVHDLIPGSKHDPFVVEDGAVQPDGVAAEFNITPAATEEEFVTRIFSVQHKLEKLLKEHSALIHLVARPTATFDVEYFNQLPEAAKELGCEPDYNAYTGDVNPKPNGARPFRTGAGHIHISWEGEQVYPRNPYHFKTCCFLVQELDSVLVPDAKKWDTDTTRMELYGKPGAFRPKNYPGVEYRVLSNAWLNSEKTVRHVYKTAKTVTEMYFSGISIRDLISNQTPERVRKIRSDFNIPEYME